ncbi:unnamed protein product [Bursaphelenchus xylophilus]|uniref:(pine wood nematode) hypothetical protein n=1 Tax=Bursaphelenchus xylophilus TaxID=6326 RepID=A0A1I7SVY5_BURXY|nr:unnamed protein product [Bursaphelenchus xylophilus]CAG9098506.1 unnamed protein product [Bursaphelenchus xylophilus]
MQFKKANRTGEKERAAAIDVTLCSRALMDFPRPPALLLLRFLPSVSISLASLCERVLPTSYVRISFVFARYALSFPRSPTAAIPAPRLSFAISVALFDLRYRFDVGRLPTTAMSHRIRAVDFPDKAIQMSVGTKSTGVDLPHLLVFCGQDRRSRGGLGHLVVYGVICPAYLELRSAKSQDCHIEVIIFGKCWLLKPHLPNKDSDIEAGRSLNAHGMVSSFSNAQPPVKSQASRKESRHIEVVGIPSSLPIESVVAYFSTFGKVQKAEPKADAEELIVSFMDVRSAQKAQNSELEINGHPLSVKVHDVGGVQNLHAGSTASTSSSSEAVELLESSRTPNLQNITENFSRRNLASTSSTVEEKKFTGLQGILVQAPHRLPESTFKQQLSNLINSSKVKCKLIDISIDPTDPTKALILLQNVPYVDSLVSEIRRSTLAALPPDQTLNAQLASHVAVTEAHNNYLTATAGALADPLPPPPVTPSLKGTNKEQSYNGPDARQREASRTLYVGSLERKIKEETLRSRFSRFGQIVEVDIKNKESPSPFAFIQFANIDSVVNAIAACQNNRAGMVGLKGERLKFKVNWGRPIPTSKLWVGGLPRSCNNEYLFSKLRSVTTQTDGVKEVIYDASHNEALVLFKNVEQSQLVHNKIKNRQLIIPPERPQKEQQFGGQQLVDYASDKLHDFFVDRKFGRIHLVPPTVSPVPSTSSSVFQWPSSTDNPLRTNTSSTADLSISRTQPPVGPESSASHALDTNAAAQFGAAPESPDQNLLEPNRSDEVLLVPPPDPPKDLITADLNQMPSELSSRHRSESSGNRHDGRDIMTRKRIKRKVNRLESTSSAGSASFDERSSSSASSRQSSPERELGSKSPFKDGHSEPSTSSVGSLNDQKPGTPPDPSQTPTFSRGKRSDEGLSSPSAIRDLDSPDGFNRARPSSNDSSGTPTTPNTPKQGTKTGSGGQDLKSAGKGPPKGKQLVLTWENISSQPPDPRRNCVHYTTNDERDLFFPTFYTEDESGYRYCRYLHGINRRPSQPLPVTPQYSKDGKSSSPISHAGITRTISSGSSDNFLTQPSDPCHDRPPSTSSSIEDPLTIPPMPPPPSTNTETVEPSNFSSALERISALTSKVDSILSTSMNPALPSRLSGSIEDDLLRFRQKKAHSMSGITTPSSTPSTPQATDLKDSKQQPKLTINIPATSSSTSSLVSSPALPPFPALMGHSLQSPVGSLNGSIPRSMSFSMDIPGASIIQPRSMSLSCAQSSPSLPLPPPPPLLASPKHSTYSPNEPHNFSLQKRASPPPPSPITPKTSRSELSATLPSSTPPSSSAPKQKTQVNGLKDDPIPTGTSKNTFDLRSKPDLDDSEDKKPKDKSKMLQFMQIPRKKEGQKDSITFLSPLNRAHATSTVQMAPTQAMAGSSKAKVPEKMPGKHQPPQVKADKKPEKRDKEKDKKEKHRLSVGSLKEVATKTMSSKERQAAYASEIERIKEKSLKKFPESKKDRELYMKTREAKLKAKFEQLKAEHEKAKKEKQRKLEEKQKETLKQKKVKEQKEKNKPPKNVEKKKSRQRTPSDESSEDDDSEDNNDPCRADFLLKSSEIEAQKILYEAAKNGSLNLSMYERIKRKRTAPRQDENKKSLALAKLKEKSEAKKKRRVHLSSCSDDSDTNDFAKKSQIGSSDESDAGTTITNLSASSAAKRGRSMSTASKKASTSSEAKKEVKRKHDDKEKEKKVKKIKQEPISDAEGESTKPSKEKEKKAKSEPKSPVPEMVSEESEGEAAVKALHNEFDAYNRDSDSDDSKPKDKKKKKLSKKSFMTNFDDGDIFAANSDDEGAEKKNKKKKNSKQQKIEKPNQVIYTGKPGRPKKVKESDDPHGEGKKKKKEEKEKDKIKKEKLAKRSLDESSSSEPAKKKHKNETEKDKKKRRVSDTDSVLSTPKLIPSEKSEEKPSLKSPLSLNLSMAPSSSSIEISPTPFTAISPTPSTGSDNVRLENFVTPSRQSETSMFSPSLQSANLQTMPLELAKPPFESTPAEDKTKKLLDVPKWNENRKRSSSTSSFTSSSTSGTSTTSSSMSQKCKPKIRTPSPKRDVVENIQTTARPTESSDTSKKAEETNDLKEETIPSEQRILDTEHDGEDSVQSTHVFGEEKSGPRPQAISLSPSRLLEEINFEESSPLGTERSNLDDDDDEMEEELLRQLSAKPKADPEKSEPVIDYSSQDTQETEDAIESISAFMENKSEDEDDETSYSLSRRVSEFEYNVSNDRTRNSTSGDLSAEEFHTPDGGEIEKEPTIPHPVEAKDSDVKVQVESFNTNTDQPESTEESTVPDDKLASVISSVARGENSASEVPSHQKNTPLVSQAPGLFSNISHLPTPPPSRSSGSSPQCSGQFQYPGAQISPQSQSGKKLESCGHPKSTIASEPGDQKEKNEAIQGPVSSVIQETNTQKNPQTSTIATSSISDTHPEIVVPPTSAYPDFQLPIQKDTNISQQMLERLYKQTKTSVSSSPVQMPKQAHWVSTPSRSEGVVTSPSVAATTSSMASGFAQTMAQSFGQNLPQGFQQTVNKNQPVGQNLNRVPITQAQPTPVIPAEHILAALQVTGIGLHALTPQHLTNPSLLISTLARSNPAMAETVQKMLMPTLPTELARLQQQQQMLQNQPKQQFLPFSNPSLMSIMQQEQQRQQVAQLQQQQLGGLTQDQYLEQMKLLQGQRTIKSEPVVGQRLTPQPQIQVKTEKENGVGFNRARYPLCWQGTLAMKSNDATVQMFLVSGSQYLMEKTTLELTEQEDGVQTIRINQRMRLTNPQLLNICNRMNNENEFVALVCIPCGQNTEQLHQQSSKMSTSFIHYFNTKMTAGVVTHSTASQPPSCIAHFFPPCDWTEDQLNRLAPEFGAELKRLVQTYLFVVVTRNDLNVIKTEMDQKPVQMPVMPQVLNCGKTV